MDHLLLAEMLHSSEVSGECHLLAVNGVISTGQKAYIILMNVELKFVLHIEVTCLDELSIGTM